METIKDMLEKTEDHITILDITNEYFLLIEPLNEDFVSINGKNYKEDKVKYLCLELNKVNSDLFITLQYDKIFENIGLNTTANELKEKVINFVFNEYIKENN